MQKKTKEPIKNFKTKEALREAGLEWQHRLFLDHWYIEYGLVDGEDVPGLGGESTAHWESCAGSISVRRIEQMPNTITKNPQELTLVHELLHFKYMPFEEKNGRTIDGAFWDIIQHQMLEQMAKALIMAKYDLDPSWFQQHFTF